MYLKEIILENTGPIGELKKQLPFHQSGDPKVFVIIGQNGAGKSVFISHIVNALISAKQLIYEDHEVEQGKVFKYRSPSYIKLDNNFSYSKVTFEENVFQSEWQLDRKKNDFEETYKFTPLNKEWQQINANETSFFNNNYNETEAKVKELFDSNCILYFPPNRFEEPGWLNYDNLLNKADYRFLKRLSNLSNRVIINYSPLKDNQNWLLDLLFDKFTLEFRTQNMNFNLGLQGGQQTNIPLPVFLGYQGESNIIHNEIIKFLGTLFQTNETLRLGVGKRRSRQIEILRNEKTWVKNLFNLSTGETILLNIFLTIIKDYDLSSANFESLNKIRGIVIIDEVDIHLHSNLQYVVLPQLIKLFPKVQFILTSHSPLFLLGLRNELGEDNFEIMNLPDGEEIAIESFSEFETAYTYYKDSIKFQQDVKIEIQNSHKALLFVEGDYDIKYLKKAAELLDKEEILNYFKLVDSDGHGNITNVSKHFDSKLAEVTPQKILLLYDCDQNKKPSIKGNIYKRVMPTYNDNPIKIGIENLFPASTIEKAIQFKTAIIDITPQIEKLVRGEKVLIPEVWEVNKNEKKNLCDWLVENGNKDDFENFASIFDILNEIKTA
jgi:energy-coupling factor transporter ATP-binding protein EcfA2